MADSAGRGNAPPAKDTYEALCAILGASGVREVVCDVPPELPVGVGERGASEGSWDKVLDTYLHQFEDFLSPKVELTSLLSYIPAPCPCNSSPPPRFLGLRGICNPWNGNPGNRLSSFLGTGGAPVGTSKLPFRVRTS
jgi:hypothetical protein